MKVSAQYAEEHFADILNAASSGEEVEIALPGKPALVLVVRSTGRTSTRSARPRSELWGAWEGKIALPTDAEWKAMKMELEDQMLDASKFNGF